jgi:hypothetical protein
MRVGRATILPAILTLGLAGSVLTGSAMSVIAGLAPTAQVQVIVAAASPAVHYHD